VERPMSWLAPVTIATEFFMIRSPWSWVAAQHMLHAPKANCSCRERTLAADSPHPLL
jgi:hypothetical protein